jgi:hypothetical protein
MVAVLFTAARRRCLPTPMNPITTRSFAPLAACAGCFSVASVVPTPRVPTNAISLRIDCTQLRQSKGDTRQYRNAPGISSRTRYSVGPIIYKVRRSLSPKVMLRDFVSVEFFQATCLAVNRLRHRATRDTNFHVGQCGFRPLRNRLWPGDGKRGRDDRGHTQESSFSRCRRRTGFCHQAIA